MTDFKDLKHVKDLSHEIERLSAQRELWPNFNPLTIPLAFYDGNNTYLFRYPGIPEGFTELKDKECDALFFSGRHPTVIASSIVNIEGTLSASLLIDKSHSRQTTTELASLAIHEAFHVFQAEGHPDWQADIGTLFLYPVEDEQLLALRRIETEALRLALTTDDIQEKRSWARRALNARNNRYDRMDADLSSFERKGELHEGLATYIESLSVERKTVDLPKNGYRADNVRGRFYQVGHALAVLLDTFAPTWKTEFETNDAQSLDLYLGVTLEKEGEQSLHIDFTQSEIANFEKTASEDARKLINERSERKRIFDSRSGVRFSVVTSSTAPLRVNGIDPSNALIIDGGVLHTRYIKLRHEKGQIEMLTLLNDGVEAMTEAAGSHPLYSGFTKLIVVGLNNIAVKTDGGSVSVESDGLSAYFEKARVDKSDTHITIYLNNQA